MKAEEDGESRRGRQPGLRRGGGQRRWCIRELEVDLNEFFRLKEIITVEFAGEGPPQGVFRASHVGVLLHRVVPVGVVFGL